MKMRTRVAAVAVAVAAVLATGCEMTHGNGCVEDLRESWVGYDLAPVPGEPGVWAWVPTDLTEPHWFTRQEDGRVYGTVACARSMPVYGGGS